MNAQTGFRRRSFWRAGRQGSACAQTNLHQSIADSFERAHERHVCSKPTACQCVAHDAKERPVDNDF